MNVLAERLERCEREIASAISESKRPQTAIEHTGILLWEMDWRMERENILSEMVSIAPVADGVLQGEPNCHFQPGE